MKRCLKKRSAARLLVALALVMLSLAMVLVACAACGGSSGSATSASAAEALAATSSATTARAPATAPRGNISAAAKATSSTAAGSQAGEGQSSTSAPSGAPSTSPTHGSASNPQATTAPTAGEETPTTAGVTVLTVTGPSGTRSYTMAELQGMASASGYWGAHKGEPPYAVDLYTGVPVLALLEEVGGLGSRALKVNTSDNFPCVWEAERFAQARNGSYQVWDRFTGAESTAGVQVIMAYSKNGSPLDSSEGPLRFVPVTASDGLVTEGKYSPYWVVSLAMQ